jgi:hypothetical protein
MKAASRSIGKLDFFWAIVIIFFTSYYFFSILFHN